jgi:hypothetical protein
MLPSSLTQITDHHDDNDIKSSSVLSSSSPSPSTTTATATATATIVSPMEAESMISSIQHFPISEIGSSSFLKMYGYQIEKLSLQAHASAAMSTTTTTSTSTTASIVGGGGGGEDEYVIDLLLTHDKVVPLVQTLLSIEAWRIFVLGSNEKNQENSRNNNNNDDDDDNINNNDNNNDTNNDTTTSNDKNESFIECIAKQGNSLRIAFILHVETTIVSLLTLLCYRKDHVMDIENKVLLSIVDYCARQMVCYDYDHLYKFVNVSLSSSLLV